MRLQPERDFQYADAAWCARRSVLARSRLGRTCPCARICFQSDEHWALMFMCVLGILMYPVAILSVALRATIMYPQLAQSRV